jgi:predicted transcriptional regulator
MKLKEVQRLLRADVVWGAKTHLETDVAYACSSDLMSDVLAYGRPGQLLLTGLSNAQSVRTAEIIEARAIVYVRGKRPDEEGLELAILKKIPLFSTKCMMFEACGILYKHGLPGITSMGQKK